LALSLVLGLTCIAEKNASPAQEKAPSDKSLEVAWSLEGSWTGVICDESKRAIYAIDGNGKCVELDLGGKQLREFKIPNSSRSILRMATLLPGKEKTLLAFSSWGEELQAFDLKGKKLWGYQGGAAINDVWASDLNGDGSDKVIIGHNGDGGLHVLDGTGKLLWKSIAIGNVWHVCAGDVLGVGKPQVVATSAEGKVHIFDGGGKQVEDLDASSYAEMVRVGRSLKKGEGAMILAAGSALVIGRVQDTQILSGMNGRGGIKWSLKLPSGSPAHVDSALLAPTKPWLAIGMRGGQVVVVDVENGKIIANSEDQGRTPAVAWASGKDSEAPLLLVATGYKLNAFRIAKNK
jgi:hypothetical protein